MGVRLERETASALAIAAWLKARPEVAEVLCPMLPGAPGHDLWQRDFTGSCGLFSFTFANADQPARDRFVDALRLFGIGFSWGGYESLVIPFGPDLPRTASEQRNPLGVRLSVGLEDPQDLIDDLAAGFAALAHR
jgi:cystathionine beta-lyase